MGYASNVAFSFTEDNWRKLCKEAEEDGRALSKRLSFDELVKSADIDKDIDINGKTYHAVAWNWWKWYDDEEDGIAFMEDRGRELCHEYIRIGEDDGDVDYEGGQFRPWVIARDGSEILVRGTSLSMMEKERLLADAIKELCRIAPDAARKWKESEMEAVEGRGELEAMFGKAFA